MFSLCRNALSNEWHTGGSDISVILFDTVHGHLLTLFLMVYLVHRISATMSPLCKKRKDTFKILEFISVLSYIISFTLFVIKHQKSKFTN